MNSNIYLLTNTAREFEYLCRGQGWRKSALGFVTPSGCVVRHLTNNRESMIKLRGLPSGFEVVAQWTTLESLPTDLAALINMGRIKMVDWYEFSMRRVQ